MTVHVRLGDEPIDPAAVLDAVRDPANGALALFVGVVRDHSDGGRVLRLDYEAYAPMAEREMRRIASASLARHGLGGIAIVHRVGALAVGDVSVVVVTAAPHRGPALRACQEAIEELKREVPIFKREHHPDGARWVDGRAGGVAPSVAGGDGLTAGG